VSRQRASEQMEEEKGDINSSLLQLDHDFGDLYSNEIPQKNLFGNKMFLLKYGKHIKEQDLLMERKKFYFSQKFRE